MQCLSVFFQLNNTKMSKNKNFYSDFLKQGLKDVTPFIIESRTVTFKKDEFTFILTKPFYRSDDRRSIYYVEGANINGNKININVANENPTQSWAEEPEPLVETFPELNQIDGLIVSDGVSLMFYKGDLGFEGLRDKLISLGFKCIIQAPKSAIKFQ